MMTIGLRPAALGPVERGLVANASADTDARQVSSTQPGPAVAAVAQEMATAVAPTQPLQESAETAQKTVSASSAIETGTSAVSPEAASDRLTAGDDALELPRPEPAGPLKSYAQIPMEIIKQINRLREEAAQAHSEEIPGRNDPTPMPASPSAIGAAMPYDAA